MTPPSQMRSEEHCQGERLPRLLHVPLGSRTDRRTCGLWTDRLQLLLSVTELCASTPPSVKGTRKSNLPQGCCESQWVNARKALKRCPQGPGSSNEHQLSAILSTSVQLHPSYTDTEGTNKWKRSVFTYVLLWRERIKHPGSEHLRP